MTPTRMLAAALAIAALAAPAASAAVPPPDVQTPARHQDLRAPDRRDLLLRTPGHTRDLLLRTPGQTRDLLLRSPGHPSGHPSVPPADPAPAPAPASSGGSSTDWAPIALLAGVALLTVVGVGMAASHRRPPSAVA